MPVQLAHSDTDILKCWSVMYLLRPHLLENEFVALIREQMQGGYHLAFVEENGLAAAAIGYRYMQKLYDGKQIYIDDLTSLTEHRGKGYGGLLLDFVQQQAQAFGCACVTLDSGPTRNDAHRLYLNKGFKIVGMHFSQPCPVPA